MTQLTVTARGQITLRTDILRHLGVARGDRIAVDKLPDGRIEVRAAQPSGNIADVFGMLKDDHRALSIEEINEAAAEGWAGGE